VNSGPKSSAFEDLAELDVGPDAREGGAARDPSIASAFDVRGHIQEPIRYP
jgi:hypothetical protein